LLDQVARAADAPLKLVVALLPPVVSVLAPRVTLPAPARLPMVSLAARLRVAPAATVTALGSGMAAPPVAVSVPALTVVVPV
jgi:hypothetical protein